MFVHMRSWVRQKIKNHIFYQILKDLIFVFLRSTAIINQVHANDVIWWHLSISSHLHTMRTTCEKWHMQSNLRIEEVFSDTTKSVSYLNCICMALPRLTKKNPKGPLPPSIELSTTSKSISVLSSLHRGNSIKVRFRQDFFSFLHTIW